MTTPEGPTPPILRGALASDIQNVYVTNQISILSIAVGSGIGVFIGGMISYLFFLAMLPT